MQPKFTQRNLWNSCAKMVTLSLFLAIFSQMTFAQNLPEAKKNHTEKTRTLEQVKAHLQSTNAVFASSVGPAPGQNGAINNGVIQTNAPGNPLSRGFCYTGAGPFQLNKQSLLNTTLTSIGAAVAFGFPGANAWVTTTNKLYTIDQASPFTLYTVDTTTGVRTTVANCTGVPQANLTGMTWDPSTNTMYGVSTTLAVSQIFTINIVTGVCTPIGAPTAVAPGVIMINAAPGGSLFSIDIVTDNLYRWNKTTGVPTFIASTGLDVNFGQDGHFDLSDGQYYWAGIGNNFGASLRIIDTTTGTSTIIGAYGGQVSALGIYSIPLVPCSGVPDPGNTLSTINPVCPGVNFTLYLSNSLSGMTYQWQSAPGVGGPWTNIGGATGSSYTTNIVAATAYRCNVVCTASGQPGSSAPLLETVNLPSACYCDAGAIDVVDEKISRVRYNTIDNSSSSTAGYENFTAISTNVIQGSTQNITVDISNFFGGDQVRVWIDFNKNGNFSDPGERVVATVTSVNPAVASITIPLTSSLGSTRMRVRMYWEPTDPDPGPCGNTIYGQVEDYSVNIVPCIQGVFNTQPANQSIQCGNNATFSFTATGSLLAYGWEYRVNASSPWLNVPALPPYSGTTTNTLTITNVPVTMSGYQYRALISGPCTAVDFSNVATLTVTPVVPIVTVVPASPICTGTVVKLTLTNILAPVSTVLINEGFTTVSPLPAGWASLNMSAPVGSTGWFQGNPAVFPANSGATNSYIAANYQNTDPFGVGTISNWLFLPNVTTIKNGDIFTFWTRKVAPDAFPDRLQVRMSLNGASTNVGANEFSVGDYTTLLLDINPTLITGVYPIVWTQYTITISGVPTPTSGRLAFRYFVTNAGGAAPNSDYIGIDDVVYTDVTGGVAAGIWTSAPSTPNSMFTDPGATIAYTGVPANTIYVKPLAPLTSTNYSVSFTTPTPCTSSTLVIPINVSSPVSITTPPADRAVCVGSNTSFTVVSGGTPLTYQWQVSVNNGLTWTNVSGGTSATLPLNAVTQLMNNNLYRVTVTAAPCGSTTTAAGRLTVNQLPTVTISSTTLQLVPGRIATITASSSPAASAVPPAPWSWTLNGSTIAGATTSSVTANIDQQGAYQATVRDVNGCVNSSNTLTIGSEPSDNLWIYPNPNKGQFQVRLYYSGTQSERRIVRIYNMLGAKVGEKSFDFDSNTSPYARLDFDLSNLSAATYIVKVVDKNGNTIHSGQVVVL